MPLKKVPFSDARESLSSLIDEVQKSGQPIAITRHGKPAAVLMNMEVLEQNLKKREEKPWMLKGSGVWVGDKDVDEAIAEIRKEFREASEKKLRKLEKELADE